MANNRQSAVHRGTKIGEADDADIDYEFESPDVFLGTHASTIPLTNTVAGPRTFYGARFVNQAQAAVNREQPLVQRLVAGSDRSFDQRYGKEAGALFADDDATVDKVEKDALHLKKGDGSTQIVHLDVARPMNRKSSITHYAAVKAGDRVKKGQLLADSSFTKNGALALGVNARIALVPYKGHSIDDATVISRSFADRLSTEHTYGYSQDFDDTVKSGKAHFQALFPMLYTRKQLDKLDDDGVVKPGAKLDPGDPVILATKPRPISSKTNLSGLSRGMRDMRMDASQTWDDHHQGTVSDSRLHKGTAQVYISALKGIKVGDKLATRSGGKCYDDKTEIMTDAGWKFFKDLTDADRVGAMFVEDGRRVARLVKPLCRVTYSYDGPMYGVRSTDVDYLVTPEHRVWCNGGGGFRAYHAHEVAGQEFHMAAVHELSPSGDQPPFDDYRTVDVRIDVTDHYVEPYLGKVHCVQVPGPGVILVRREGKAHWNGNCIVGKILQDDHMPRGEDGKPLDLLLNPLSLYSRVNDQTIYSMLLGKIAAKTGKPYVLEGFNPEGTSVQDFVRGEADRHGVKEREQIFDPLSGRHLENPVTTGTDYILRLHHLADSKISDRGVGAYSQDEQPARGSGEQAQAKRLSGLETSAMLSSGAYANLREGATLRGQRNDAWWRALREGETVPNPQTPFVWHKFRALLAGSGYRTRDEGNGQLRLGPYTDRDLAKENPVEIQNAETIDMHTLAPVKGGLFDPVMAETRRYGKITLPFAVPLPSHEHAIRKILNISEKNFREVMAGRMTLTEARKKG